MEGATEKPFTGKYWNHKEEGIYHCAECDSPLFSSKDKFDSGSGWPSFSAPLNKEALQENLDTSHNMVRTEVACKKCGSHLGHLFPDGPPPTGQRYCINSYPLAFKKSN